VNQNTVDQSAEGIINETMPAISCLSLYLGHKLDLFNSLRKKGSITSVVDWTQRESMQAEIRLKVKKILRKYGYFPDKEKKATETVLDQAEIIVKHWAVLYSGDR
jgi:hypothetical protein